MHNGAATSIIVFKWTNESVKKKDRKRGERNETNRRWNDGNTKWRGKMLIHLQLVEVTFRYTQNAFVCLNASKICRCHCHYRLLNFDLCTTMRKSSHLTTILRAIFSSYTIKSSSFHSFASIYDCIYERKPFKYWNRLNVPMCVQSFAVKWYILIIAKQHQWTMAWPQVWVIGVTFDGIQFKWVE